MRQVPAETIARRRVGVVFPCTRSPVDITRFAQDAEAAGFDELWVVEDCFYGGGITTAAHALEATTRIRVGIGILPVGARNPAFLAMETSALGELHPGRLTLGLGHGMPAWMAQVGHRVASPLTELAEVVSATKRLLAGERVSIEGRYVHLNGVELAFAPDPIPPVVTGVRGARSLELSGRVADGTILAEPVSTTYVHVARERIDAGARAAQRSSPHEITAYVVFRTALTRDGAFALATQALQAALIPGTEAHLAGLDFTPELLMRVRAAQANGELAILEPEWVDALTVSGTAQGCADSIHRLHEAGVDSVCLHPPADLAEFFENAREVLELVGQFAESGSDSSAGAVAS